MIKTIVEDEQGGIYEVPSSSSNQKYVVAIDENDLLYCSCPDFRYHRLNGRLGVPLTEETGHCKHIKEVVGDGK